jgi:hypothetical protein
MLIPSMIVLILGQKETPLVLLWQAVQRVLI